MKLDDLDVPGNVLLRKISDLIFPILESDEGETGMDKRYPSVNPYRQLDNVARNEPAE